MPPPSRRTRSSTPGPFVRVRRCWCRRRYVPREYTCCRLHLSVCANHLHDTQLLRLGACRAPVPSFRAAQHSLAPLRSLSTFNSPHWSLRAHALQHTTPVSHLFVHSRSLSIASLFRRPSALPPPSVVANVSKLEAEADAHPEDVEKQVALFEALVNTKVKPGLNTIVARWERTCEFVCVSSEVVVCKVSLCTEPITPPHSVGHSVQAVPHCIARPRPRLVHQLCC